MATSGKRLDSHTRSRIIQMRKQGVPTAQVAQAQQVSKTIVNRIFRNHIDKFSTGNSNQS